MLTFNVRIIEAWAQIGESSSGGFGKLVNISIMED